ncbi:hypothetical protein EBR04_06985, partial [bacterium]|nr:hypothetical protein [bacterium]
MAAHGTRPDRGCWKGEAARAGRRSRRRHHPARTRQRPHPPRVLDDRAAASRRGRPACLDQPCRRPPSPTAACIRPGGRRPRRGPRPRSPL